MPNSSRKQPTLSRAVLFYFSIILLIGLAVVIAAAAFSFIVSLL